MAKVSGHQIPRVWLSLGDIGAILQAHVFGMALSGLLEQIEEFSVPEIEGCTAQLSRMKSYVQRRVAPEHNWNSPLLGSFTHQKDGVEVEVYFEEGRAYDYSTLVSEGLRLREGLHALLALSVVPRGNTPSEGTIYFLVVRWDAESDCWLPWNEHTLPSNDQAMVSVVPDAPDIAHYPDGSPSIESVVRAHGGGVQGEVET